MAQFSKALDIYQGFNYRKDKTTAVGFITALKVATTTLTADFTCKDPLSPTTDVKAVLVLGNALWGLGVTDALYFSGQMSATNKQSVATLLMNDLTNVEVLLQFAVYEYDPVAKKYFKCFHCNDTEMKGILEKNGGDLNISVADDQSTEVQSPINYSFQIGIKPQPSQQSLTVASADAKNVVKAWGLTNA